MRCSHAVDAVGCDESPKLWGIMLADTIHHIARGREMQYGESQKRTIKMIQKAINVEIKLQLRDPDRGNISGGLAQ